ncbi:MAG: 4-phosphopantetheinyl transferase [Sphingomonadales bacterium]|jgi:4'-phosphopantetheinyl transferase|nr:4-phosphopantetheinyl transferase [Sphingomonadales bacterium]
MGRAAIASPEPGRDGRFAPAQVAEPLPAPAPADARVRLWRIMLDRTAGDVARLSALLDSDERGRAARYLHDRDRARYVVGRAAMRILLAAQGDLAPEALRFRTGPRGKPELHSDGCHFNLSRSGGIALLAIGPEPLGIDVERLKAIPEMERIAEEFFSGPEIAWLRAAPEAARSHRFLRLWTRKEALVKADGRGIAEDLRGLDLVPGDGSGVADVAAWGRRWRIEELSAGPRHVAALALGRELPR